MSFLPPVRLKYKGQISAFHAASASSALRADLQHRRHQQRQSGDKVAEIADTTPQLEEAPRWPPKQNQTTPANFFPHHVLIYTAVTSWKKFRAFYCKK